jgi:hypothetical protein
MVPEWRDPLRGFGITHQKRGKRAQEREKD